VLDADAVRRRRPQERERAAHEFEREEADTGAQHAAQE
jgi:hypothetical protein